MTNLSALQAISPAIERTKQFLFRPFRLGRFLKLTLVAVLTEGGMASCNFNSHIPSGATDGADSPLHRLPPFHMPQLHGAALPMVIAVAAALVLIVIPVAILLSYLLIRLRFSYFDCVLRMQDRIAPAWSRYHRQAMRYLGMSLCVGLAFGAAIAAIGYGVYEHFKPLFLSLWSEDKPPFTAFLPLIGTVFLLMLLLALLGALVDIALGSFVLPHMALEDASIADALGDVWSDIEVEPWQYLLFILMRFLLTVAASIIGVIALLVPFLILGGIGVMLVLLLKGASMGLAVLFGVPAGILLLGLFLLAFIGISGTIGTFRRNYALLFYGGRYPLLGDILQPPMPSTPLPPWGPGIVPGMPSGAQRT